jgi:hypothetical protein
MAGMAGSSQTFALFNRASFLGMAWHDMHTWRVFIHHSSVSSFLIVSIYVVLIDLSFQRLEPCLQRVFSRLELVEQRLQFWSRQEGEDLSHHSPGASIKPT